MPGQRRKPLLHPVVVVAVAAALAGGGWDDQHAQALAASASRSSTAARVTVTPRQGSRRTAFVVAFTTRRRTGTVGDRRSVYFAEAHAVKPRSACVNNRDGAFPTGPRGSHVRLRLTALGGEGGNLGWCRGRFRGSVSWVSGYACPPKGTCRAPASVPERRMVVGRFSFVVR